MTELFGGEDFSKEISTVHDPVIVDGDPIVVFIHSYGVQGVIVLRIGDECRRNDLESGRIHAKLGPLLVHVTIVTW